MTKKRKGILVWILILAGMLILILYSPVGSRDLYSRYYYEVNQTVIYKDGVILNAPRIRRTFENNDNELNVPDVSSLSKANYAVGNYQTTNNFSQGSSYSVQTQTFQNNNSGSGGQMGGGNLFANGSSRNSTGTSGVEMTNGITTLSFAKGLFNSSAKQGAPFQNDSGGTDPGSDLGMDEIPVGNGWGLLFLFGLCYAAFIKKINIE